MIQQEILKGLTLSVGNGGMSLSLEPKAQITKRDGGVFLNGVLVPFMSANDWTEGEATPEQVKGLIRRSTRMVESRKGDASYATE
jgi:hypothetical protein